MKLGPKYINKIHFWSWLVLNLNWRSHNFRKKNPCHNMKILKIKDFNLVPLIEDIKRNLILPEFFSWPIFRIFKVIFKFFFIILGFKLSTAWIKTPSHKYINHLISLQPIALHCIPFVVFAFISYDMCIYNAKTCWFEASILLVWKVHKSLYSLSQDIVEHMAQWSEFCVSPPS